jgi:propionyl-CoA synthetase
MGMSPGETYWAASDIGWVVGHSFIVYAPLFNGNTTILYEGKPVGTPDAGAFWRVVNEHKVSAMFTAPTAMRAIKKEDPMGESIAAARADTAAGGLESLRTLFLAGERSDPDTISYCEQHLADSVAVIDNYWQTETGWPVAGQARNFSRRGIKAGSVSFPNVGWDVRILGDSGEELEPSELGGVYAKLPLPPGALQTIWEDEERCQKAYFSTVDGFYECGDAGMIDEDGYLSILSRTDDIINVAGHRYHLVSLRSFDLCLALSTTLVCSSPLCVFGMCNALRPYSPTCAPQAIDRADGAVNHSSSRRSRGCCGRCCGFTQRRSAVRFHGAQLERRQA